MKVILTKDLDTLGASGDVVDVADGYARNYLFPKNVAVEATDGSLADLGRRIERIRAKAEKKHADDLEKAKKVEAVGVITLEAKAGETGKLFGTITTKELAKILAEKTGQEFERRNINVDHPINKVGEYTLNVKISAKVSAHLKIDVKPIVTKEEEFRLSEAFAEDDKPAKKDEAKDEE